MTFSTIFAIEQHWFIQNGNYGEADDFLQALFAIPDLLEQVMENHQAFFQGCLEALYASRGGGGGYDDYEENKRLFLQRNLRVAQLVENADSSSSNRSGASALAVLEIMNKRLLIKERVFVEEWGTIARPEEFRLITFLASTD
jgi:hypothetical protein